MPPMNVRRRVPVLTMSSLRPASSVGSASPRPSRSWAPSPPSTNMLILKVPPPPRHRCFRTWRKRQNRRGVLGLAEAETPLCVRAVRIEGDIVARSGHSHACAGAPEPPESVSSAVDRRDSEPDESTVGRDSYTLSSGSALGSPPLRGGERFRGMDGGRER